MSGKNLYVLILSDGPHRYCRLCMHERARQSKARARRRRRRPRMPQRIVTLRRQLAQGRWSAIDDVLGEE